MKRCTVMIVEDEVPMREQLRAFPWERHGFELAGEARHGLEALSLFEALRPDIVVTDVAMPFMDGLELMRRLKEADAEAQFVLLTCHSEFGYVRDALLLGACDYLVKGMYREADLLEALERARGKRGEASSVDPGMRFEIRQAVQFIENHLHLPFTVTDVAERVGLSQNYFGILFRRETGRYFQDYVKGLRMEKAAALLRNSSLKIYEIAEQVGIGNYRYFTDVFQKHFGINPREFRGKS